MNNKETTTAGNYIVTSEKRQKETSNFFHDFTAISNQKSGQKKGDFFVGSNRGEYTVFSAPGIHIWDGNIEITSTHKLFLQTVKPVFQLIFCAEGTIGYQSGFVKNTLEKSHHNLLYTPPGEIRFEWHIAKRTHLVIVTLSEEYFIRLVPINDGELSEMRQLINTNSAGWLAKLNMNINQQCLFILQHLSGKQSESAHKRLFIEAKVLELLAYQLEQFHEMKTKGEAYTLKSTEVEKMYLVRAIILENLSTHHSLVQLAHMVGTNECYLKDHFKKVFGTTVYAFTQRAKMEKARELILAGGKKISDVAKTTGYKYTSHFTSSFKKHFGVLPNKIKLIVILFHQELECISMVMYEMAI
ncbi:helix-turn-helix domain-containing protein [Flavitalea sp.]|nr:AraC family transcriptional regulator [Flavitalea sp.]